MNPTEHLLVCLNEECVEIAKDCDKALRFGLDDKLTTNPDGPRGAEGPTNIEKIVGEINDLLGVVLLLEARGVIPFGWNDLEKQQRKMQKVNDFMRYARHVGALQDENSVTDVAMMNQRLIERTVTYEAKDALQVREIGELKFSNAKLKRDLMKERAKASSRNDPSNP